MKRAAACTVLVLLLAAGGIVLLGRSMALEAPPETGALPLYASALAGEGRAVERWTRFLGERVVRNVTAPTLTPVLPDPARATGAAVIIAPGGGFQMLSMDNEGWPIAHWLAQRGVAAFVLKYRLQPTPDNDIAWLAAVIPRMASVLLSPGRQGSHAAPRQATEDALRAMDMVLARAAQWGVDPTRVGLMGFSAGASTALSATLESPAGSRPAFLALVYGPMGAVDVAPGAPPLFAALALDDPLFGEPPFEILDSWRGAGLPVTFHAYEGGSHGFGIGRPGTDSVRLMDDLYAWLVEIGVLDAMPDATRSD
jgi:acetyl esterase/lipase